MRQDPEIAAYPAAVLLRIDPQNGEARDFLLRSIKPLTETLGYDDMPPELAVLGADVCGKLGRGASAAIPALTRLLKSQFPQVRKAAREALGRIGSRP